MREVLNQVNRGGGCPKYNLHFVLDREAGNVVIKVLEMVREI